jgi:hypothetical protein
VFPSLPPQLAHRRLQIVKVSPLDSGSYNLPFFSMVGPPNLVGTRYPSFAGLTNLCGYVQSENARCSRVVDDLGSALFPATERSTGPFLRNQIHAPC